MTQITVPDVPSFKEYSVIVSSTGPFIVPFAFFDEDDVKATVTDALGAVTALVHSTDFTFDSKDVPVGQEGTGYEGGAISLNVAIGADGATTLRIYRDTVIDRVANFASTGPFLPIVLNDEQNKFVMMLQEIIGDTDQVVQNTIDIANQAGLIADLTANDPGGSYALLTNLISVLNGKGAALIGFEDAAGDFTAVDVEAAIVELKALHDALEAGTVATNAADIITNAAAIAANTALIPVSSAGTFTPVHIGFSAAPAGDIDWFIQGNIITVMFKFLTGTSNAFSWSITNVPAAIQTNVGQNIPLGPIMDNGVLENSGCLATNVGATWTFQNWNLAGAAGIWVNSGLKGMNNLNKTISFIKDATP